MEDSVYMVCGIYKDGTITVAYRLMASNGTIVKKDIEQTEKLIEDGKIHNMRIQITNGRKIIRGKGINLNNLSVYDASELDVENKYELKSRVMHKSKCIGYEIKDSLGSSKIISKAEAMDMIEHGKITNAEIRKVNNKGKIASAIVGVGYKISQLETIIVSNGKIVNQKDESENTCRMYITRRSGILVDKKSGDMQRFRIADALVYSIGGKIQVMDSDDLEKMPLEHNADSDLNIDGCSNYEIRYSNGKRVQLNNDIVAKWVVCRVVKSAQNKL